MKLPSLTHILERAKQTFVRFPMPILAAAVAAMVSVASNHFGYKLHWGDLFERFTLPAALGIPLFFAISVFEESKKENPSSLRKSLLNLMGVALLVAYGLTFSSHARQAYSLRYFQLSLATHLLVAFSAYMDSGRLNGFWQFNRRLFLRFILAEIFTVTLAGGTCLAIWGSSYLLGFKVNYRVYSDIWVVCSFVYTTWVFLAGIPDDLADLDQDVSYPVVLKVFTQYLLLPLVTVYVLILYAYMMKIIGQHAWPKGKVGYLVSGVSVLGIFSLLLVYPISQKDENRWIRLYTRTFYWSLLPLVGMLIAGTVERVGDYGITEKRYFLFIIGLWIAGISLYFSLSRSKNIKTIPMSLCTVALLTAFGPWGAYSVSIRSQYHRLERLLTKVGVLQSGTIQKASAPVAFEDKQNISSILQYFSQVHGLDKLKPLLGDVTNKNVQQISKELGFSFVNEYEHAANQGYWSVNTRKRYGDLLSYDVKGFDFVVARMNNYLGENFVIDGSTYEVHVDSTGILYVSENHQRQGQYDLAAHLIKIGVSKSQESALEVPQESLSFDVDLPRLKMRFYLESVSGAMPDKPLVNNLEGLILVKRK